MPVESFRTKKAGGTSDERDSSCATMTMISEAAADQKQTCQFELCQTFASYYNDDKFLTLTTVFKCRNAARPRKRSEVLTSRGRSLSGGGGLGGVALICNASVIARINGILKIGNILGSWKGQGSCNLLATAHTYMTHLFYFSCPTGSSPGSVIYHVRY